MRRTSKGHETPALTGTARARACIDPDERNAGCPSDIVRDRARLLALKDARRRVEASVPCNGCTACCYHKKIPVEDEPPEVLRHLDLVPDPDREGGVMLRKRRDGACVHLGPEGCTVYSHRPGVCRIYDCRPAVIFGPGASVRYTRDRWAPRWVATITSEAEREIEAKVCEIALTLMLGRGLDRHTAVDLAVRAVARNLPRP